MPPESQNLVVILTCALPFDTIRGTSVSEVDVADTGMPRADAWNYQVPQQHSTTI